MSADEPFKGCNPGYVFLHRVGSRRLPIECIGFVFLHSDESDPGEAVALGEAVQRLAGDELLRDLRLESNAVRSVSCHGFHPLKARQLRSITLTQCVHPEGPTPIGGQHSAPIDTDCA